MSRSLANAGAARVAIVGAATPCGTLVREALAKARVPGARVDLFGATEGDAVLSEYDGEARLIQEPEADDVAAHDVVFLCEAAEPAVASLARLGGGTLVVDLVGFSRASGTPVIHPAINPAAARGHRGVVRVPHPLATLLAEILHPAEVAAGIRKASAVVLRPASDFGERGLEELRDQTVGLLRFSDPPKEVFGGLQLAFNVIPQRLLAAADEPGLEGRVAEEVASLFGWKEGRLTVSFAVVPVFYGHAAFVRIETVREVEPATLRAAWSTMTTAGKARPSGIAATPLDAVGDRRASVSDVAADGLGGFWLWAVAGEVGPASAALAVRIAELTESG